MSERAGAVINLPDGSSETWVAAEGVKLSPEAVAEFIRICFKPKPESVEPILLTNESGEEEQKSRTIRIRPNPPIIPPPKK